MADEYMPPTTEDVRAAMSIWWSPRDPGAFDRWLAEYRRQVVAEVFAAWSPPLVPIEGERGERHLTRQQLVEAGWADVVRFQIALMETMRANPHVAVQVEEDVIGGGVTYRWRPKGPDAC